MIRQSSLSQHWQSALVFAVVALYLVALCFHFGELVPAWDAGWYFACLLNAVEAPFRVGSYNCVGHASFLYMFMLAPGQKLAFGSTFLLYLTNAFLWFVALLAFWRILLRLFPEKSSFECALFTALLGVMPVPVAHIFHLNLDFGVMVFGVLTLFCFLTKRFVLAAIVGTCMCFSKELGAAIYCAMLGAFGALHLAPEVRAWRKERGSLKHLPFSYLLLASPIGVYAFRALVRFLRRTEGSVFYTESSFESRSLLDVFFDFKFWEATFRTYLVDVFLLNFNWVLSLFFLAALLNWLRGDRGQRLPVFANTERSRDWWFVVLVFLAVLYLITRHRPFNHVRYLLPAFPLFFLCAYGALSSCVRNAAVRLSLFILVLPLFLVSTFRTVDPLSKSLYGTFKFGQREMLNMASAFYIPTTAHSEFIRDELVYNLEYQKIHEIVNWIFQDLPLDPHFTFMGSRDSRFFWPEMVDLKKLHRTGRRSDVFRPHYFDTVEQFSDVVEKPKTLRYLEFPSMRSPQQFEQLKRWYRYQSSTRYQLDGYAMDVHSFEMREPQ